MWARGVARKNRALDLPTHEDSFCRMSLLELKQAASRLPKRQRLEMAESLWLSVADEKKMPVPEAHKKILDARLANYRAGKSRPIAHEELMRRLRTS